MTSDAEAALAGAWIAAQDELDDETRMDSVRVAADRLQAEEHALGELVTLGFAWLEGRDASVRAAYLERVAALLPEALGRLRRWRRIRRRSSCVGRFASWMALGCQSTARASTRDCSGSSGSIRRRCWRCFSRCRPLDACAR